MEKTTKFNRGRNNGTVVCRVCSKRTWRDRAECLQIEGGKLTGLCADCYDYAGWENEHSDRNHEKHPDPNCPVCKGIKPADETK